ncbi:hypothetical protein GGI15_003820, partial [Coemansia interrupta]
LERCLGSVSLGLLLPHGFSAASVRVPALLFRDGATVAGRAALFLWPLHRRRPKT